MEFAQSNYLKDIVYLRLTALNASFDGYELLICTVFHLLLYHRLQDAFERKIAVLETCALPP